MLTPARVQRPTALSSHLVVQPSPSVSTAVTRPPGWSHLAVQHPKTHKRSRTQRHTPSRVQMRTWWSSPNLPQQQHFSHFLGSYLDTEDFAACLPHSAATNIWQTQSKGGPKTHKKVSAQNTTHQLGCRCAPHRLHTRRRSPPQQQPQHRHSQDGAIWQSAVLQHWGSSSGTKLCVGVRICPIPSLSKRNTAL